MNEDGARLHPGRSGGANPHSARREVARRVGRGEAVLYPIGFFLGGLIVPTWGLMLVLLRTGGPRPKGRGRPSPTGR